MKSKILSILACVLLVSTIATAQEQEKKGTLTFDKTIHDFGTVKEEAGKVTYEFEFTNSGEAPVIISNVTASCGCTTPQWDKEPILPGKKAKVTVGYSTTGRPGPFVKSLVVLNNGNPSSITLQIKGEVTPKPKATPAN